LHVWGSRAEHIEQPDLIVFDLDPSEELPWSAVVEAALELRERIEALGLVGFVRVTGGKGLHVVVPVVPGPKWPSVKRFAHALVNEMVRDAPARYTGTLSKRRRVGKIFIDYLRNARGATAIAPYSTRALPGGPVALPVAWDELKGLESARAFTIPAVLRRLAASPPDPWKDLSSSAGTHPTAGGPPQKTRVPRIPAAGRRQGTDDGAARAARDLTDRRSCNSARCPPPGSPGGGRAEP
jgi:bifunctional non-homologous end joining protein LigD